jgi:crotonobetainyl-CoA:carnitine CoA-transferase CaiB-like acyl-CoA transferase
MAQQGALSDLRVIDLGHFIAGPYCASLLAGMGAEVIKVERPGTGDAARQMGPFPNDETHLEKSGLFSYLNLGKKSITLNLKSEAGREAFRRLVVRTDILIENFEPRVMSSLGLAYENLSKLSPRLIMTSISNYGQTGPYRDYKGYEITLNALGGVQAEIGEPDREPIKLGGQQLQFQAGLTAAFAAMSAVIYRDKGGTGQHIDLAIVEVAAMMKGAPLTYYQFTGYRRVRNGMRPMADSPRDTDRPGLKSSRSGGALYPIAILPCKDGYVCVDTEATPQWLSLLDMMARPDLKDDTRFRGGSRRGDNADVVDDILREYLKDKTQRELFEECTAWRVPLGIVNDMATLFHDPQHRSRGFFIEVEHPVLGKLEYPGHAFIMNETPWQVSRAPLLGEHNREILIDRLGYSEEEVTQMARDGVI